MLYEVITYAPKELDIEPLGDKLKDSFKVTEISGQKSLVLRDSSALYNEIENEEIRVRNNFV